MPTPAFEFIDTNVLVYAYDANSTKKGKIARELLARLGAEANGALSVQVLCEFVSVGSHKLQIESRDLEKIISRLSYWTLHRPAHQDVLQSLQLRRRLKISWWDALVINSALELDCSTLWTEDLSDGRKIGSLTVRNPFA